MSSGPCGGCLGSVRCWVCLGRGVVGLRDGSFATCTRCFGSGACSMCQPTPVPEPVPRRRWPLRRTNVA